MLVAFWHIKAVEPCFFCTEPFFRSFCTLVVEEEDIRCYARAVGAQSAPACQAPSCLLLLQAVGHMGSRRSEALQARQRQEARRQGGAADAEVRMIGVTSMLI